MVSWKPPPAVQHDVAENLQDIFLHLIDDVGNEHRLHSDPKKFESFCSSIRAWGLMHPVILQARSDGRYKINAGSRRVAACRHLKHETIRAHIVELSDLDGVLVSGHENTSREDAPLWQKTIIARNALMKFLYIYSKNLDKFLNRVVNCRRAGMPLSSEDQSLEHVAKQIIQAYTGKDLPYFVRYCMPLLKLDQTIIAQLERGTITHLLALEINKIEDVKVQRRMLETVVRDGVSLADVRRSIRKPGLPNYVILGTELNRMLRGNLRPDVEEQISVELSKLIELVKRSTTEHSQKTELQVTNQKSTTSMIPAPPKLIKTSSISKQSIPKSTPKAARPSRNRKNKTQK
jgi:ParB/RepB/Spo0J family partition protein